jgi:prevent-host-death family protein
MKLERDIMSLSTFKRDSNKVVRQMRKTKEPVILTVNGKAALVIQDAASYQRLLEIKERQETIDGIRRGLESMKAGRGKPADEFFKEFFAKNNIPEED